MRRLRWVAWFASLLLVAALAVSGAHVHHGPANDTGCVACTLAHAPAQAPDTAPAVRAPEPTRELARESSASEIPAPLGALPDVRGPPLG